MIIFVYGKQTALSSLGGSPWEIGRQKLADEPQKLTSVDLEHYARARWDSVLHFMVGLHMIVCTIEFKR